MIKKKKKVKSTIAFGLLVVRLCLVKFRYPNKHFAGAIKLCQIVVVCCNIQHLAVS